MKKYKIRFSLFNLFSDTQSEIAGLQTYVKSFTAMLGTTAWFTLSPMHSLYVGIVGFAVDAILHCIHLDEVK